MTVSRAGWESRGEACETFEFPRRHIEAGLQTSGVRDEDPGSERVRSPFTTWLILLMTSTHLEKKTIIMCIIRSLFPLLVKGDSVRIREEVPTFFNDVHCRFRSSIYVSGSNIHSTNEVIGGNLSSSRSLPLSFRTFSRMLRGGVEKCLKQEMF